MTKRTLSNKSRFSILRVSGFRARMATTTGRKTIKNRRRKGRKKLALNH
jgi:ribosomal protein L34